MKIGRSGSNFRTYFIRRANVKENAKGVVGAAGFEPATSAM